MLRTGPLLLLAAAALLTSVPAASAATFTVTRTDDAPPDTCAANGCTLREAIIAANGAAGTDVVQLGAAQHDVLSIPGVGEDNAATGDLDVTGPVTIEGAGATVDAHGIDRVFDVQDLASTTFHHLTITGGSTTGEGGGIEVESQAGPTSSPVTLDGVRVTGNHADSSGGGINTNYFRPLTLTHSTVDANTSGDYGGGIFLYDKGTLIDTSIHDNVAADRGGGIARRSVANLPLALTRVAIDRNRGTLGGGLYAENGNVSATDVEVAGNVAEGFYGGGGIFSGFVTTGDLGLALTNATVTGNTGSDQGGGLLLQTATLTNVTLSGDVAATAGDELAATGSVAVRSSIIDGSCAPIGAAAVITGDGHDVERGTSCGFTAGGSRQGVDPLLSGLSETGAVTVGAPGSTAPLRVLALRPGSPALDHGDPATCPGADLRGVLRPQGPGCDSGAFEATAADLAPPFVPLPGQAPPSAAPPAIVPGPAPPASLKPRVALKLGAISRTRAARARSLTVRLTLNEAATVTLRALRVRTAKATKGSTLGRLTVKVTKAGSRTVHVKLSRQTAAVLRRKGSATLRITASAKDHAGHVATAAAHVTLKR